MCHLALEYKISYALQNHFQFFPFLSKQVVGRNVDDTCQFCAHKKETQPRHVSLLSLQFYINPPDFSLPPAEHSVPPQSFPEFSHS